MSDLYWDPFTPELRDDPYPLWKRMRDEAPVWHNERHDFWVLARYHDIETAHQDPETYSSSHGTTVELMGPDAFPDSGMIIWLDPPKHTKMRHLVSRAFTKRRISQIEQRTREVIVRLLDAQVDKLSFDYVQDFGAILPPTIISSMLGVPEADQEPMRHVIDESFHIEEGVGMMNPVAARARGTLNEYLASQFEERRKKPRDDMFTDLVHAEIINDQGEIRRLSEQELVDFGGLLFVAGTETVARHLGWVAKTLDEYPDQRAALAGDLSLVPGAIEEILRYEPPSPVNARRTTKDVTLHGVTMPKDSKVVLLTGSAGRDERKYPNPDVLDIHRKVDLHMSFGFGIHFCLGASLARMEARMALEETLKRWPEWKVDHDNAVPLYTSTVRGYANLPIFVN